MTSGNGDGDDSDDDRRRSTITRSTIITEPLVCDYGSINDKESSKQDNGDYDVMECAGAIDGVGGGGTIGFHDDDERITPDDSEVDKLKRRKMEVIGDDDVAAPPLPIAKLASALEVDDELSDVYRNTTQHRSKQLVAKTRRKLEIIDVGEDDAYNMNAPVPVEQQFVPSKTKSCVKQLEVIGIDGEYDEYIQPPVPIEQIAADMGGDKKGAQLDRISGDTFSRSAATGHVDDYAKRNSILIRAPLERLSTLSSVDAPSPLPVFDAMIVEDDVVYDAVVVHPTWWKRNRKYVISIVCGILVATAAVVLVVAILRGRDQEQSIGNQNGGDIIIEVQNKPAVHNNSLLAFKSGVCFTNLTELKTAVNEYTKQSCSKDGACEVEQKYGWPMNSWCVSNITDMSTLFSGPSTFNENISDWDVSSVTNMFGMFFGAFEFNGDLSRWDTSSVIDMSRMFYGAAVFNCNLSSWNVSSVTDMYEMFHGATAFDGDVSSWDVSSVTSAIGMFDEATSFNGDLSSWNVSSVTSMVFMFNNAYNFNSNLSSWDVSSVANMENMFSNAPSFNGDLSSWDVSSVISMYAMFAGASAFNGDLSSWNVSSVNRMVGMFSNAASFNGDVSSWDVSSVIDTSDMFSGATVFNCDLSSWDVSSVTNMYGMFAQATEFNGDLSGWKVSAVTNMASMFRNATSFNGDLSSWDVSSVTDMSAMFEDAVSFNQDLCNWRDAFPYSSATDIFDDSGCTFETSPTYEQQGPFCAYSSCQS